MSAVRNVLIVGGGIGGMVLAYGLRRVGIDVRVIEVNSSDHRQGAGINLLNNSLAALQKIGLLEACLEKGFGYDMIRYLTGQGVQYHEQVVPRAFSPNYPAMCGMLRSTLADILEEKALGLGAQISYNTTVEKIDNTKRGVTALLSDGTEHKCDLLVAADGVYSKTRTAIFGAHLKPQYAGTGGWRLTGPLPPNTDSMSFVFEPHTNGVGIIPLSKEICYLFMLEHSSGHIAMDKSKLDVMLTERLARITAPQVKCVMQGMRGPQDVLYRPFDILFVPEPWHINRVVLLGDAAHSMTPQLTSGGGMAIEDAVVLAEELAKSIPVEQALEDYNKRRVGRVHKIFDNTYQLCKWEQEQMRDEKLTAGMMQDSFAILAQPI